MNKLARSDLMTLEDYHSQRAEFRARVLAHKKLRQVTIGEHATLYFEDRLTVLYQVQEMLRIERIFAAEAIEEELQAYNPLIPDGSNLKATFMLEFPDPGVRREALQRLRGIEDCVYARVADGEKILAVADEDLERSSDDKTSAVHFLRFELSADFIGALRRGADLGFGIEHPEYPHGIDAVPAAVRAALLADLD